MKLLSSSSGMVAGLSILLCVGCTPAPTNTPVAALPTYTPYPTHTPLSTFTPFPKPTDAPTATHTSTPTSTPKPPTATPLPDFVLRGARTKYTFEQIVPLLSSPQLVSLFMSNNISYTLQWDQMAGGNEYAPAWVTYERGSGKCVGHAILQCYILEKNGWDAFMIGLSIESDVVGHNVCGVKTNGKILVLDNEGKMEGYFNTLPEIARHYIAAGNMKDGGTLRTISASAITQIIAYPAVFGLPWSLQEY